MGVQIDRANSWFYERGWVELIGSRLLNYQPEG